MITGWNWPSREEWARNRRAFYLEHDRHPCPATRRLPAYATTGEIAIVIAELKAMIREARRAEPASYNALGPLGRQRGENKRAYDGRFLAMSKKEQEIVIAGLAPVWPGDLTPVLKELQKDIVPSRWPVHGIGAPPLLDAIIARYQAAEHQADEAWRRIVKATPIDDAAWEEELERRRQSEDNAAHPERFIHRA
jgi:hypothetical protein